MFTQNFKISKLNWEINYEKLKFKREYRRVVSIIKTAQTDKDLAIEKLRDYLDKRWLKTHNEGLISNGDHLSETQL